MSERPDFAVLDALLERALDLEGQAREAFLASLTDDQRAQVVRLLQLSDALTLAHIAADVAHVAKTSTSAGTEAMSEAGRWRLMRELGSGGMGQVFLARREETGADHPGGAFEQTAAIKVLWSHQCNDDVKSRFYRERRILASLDHPGLARFLDGGFLGDGRPWFAMEYIEGRTLIEYAAERPIGDRLMLFRQICDTMTYAHGRLVIHRDVKPQNVLVDASGRPRLLDFGIATLLDDVDDGVATRTQGAPLTLRYASPEQLTGAVVTVASDVYQLGLLLYELLSGAPAYDHSERSLRDAIAHMCHDMPSLPSKRNPQISADLDAIVQRAIAKEPEDRYQTVTDLARDIDLYLSGHPVQAMTPSPWYVARRFILRNKLLVGMSAALVTVFAIAALVSTLLASEARDQARRSTAAQKILADVFAKSDPFAAGGAGITLVDALIQARPQIDAQVADDPQLAWEVNQTLAEIYQNLGLIEHEVAAYQAVIDAAKRMHDTRSKEELIGIAGIGNALARTNPARAIEWLESHLPDEPTADEVTAWLDGQYAYVGSLDRERQFERAAAETARMADVIERHGVTSPRTLARLHQFQGNDARRRGDIAAEDLHWAKNVEYMRQANVPPALAVALSNRAIFLGRNDRYEESDAAFREAIAFYESAKHTDSTYADVLRGYSGLLFRTGRRDEAVATSLKALAMLDPSKQAYSRFVAENSLVNYLFVMGDVEQTVSLLLSSVAAAQTSFDRASNVAKRMRSMLAKVLVFAHEEQLAARVLSVPQDAAATDEALHASLDALEDPAEADARTRLWSSVATVRTALDAGTLQQATLDDAVARYRDQPVFFDMQDRWRALQVLGVAHSRVGVVSPLLAELDAHRAKRDAAAALVAARRDEIVRLVAYFDTPAAPAAQNTALRTP